MKLKDIFSLPKNSDSLKIIKDFLGQNLNYKDNIEVFLLYSKILLDNYAYDVLIKESKELLKRYENYDYDLFLDEVYENIVEAEIKKENFNEAQIHLNYRKKNLPILKRYRHYYQSLILKIKLQQPYEEWLEKCLIEDMPIEIFEKLSIILLEKYINDSNYTSALEIYKKLEIYSPEKHEIFAYKIYDGLKDYNTLIQRIEKLKSISNNYDAIFYLAKSYIKMQNFQKAINVEVENESFISECNKASRLKFYKLMIDMYTILKNNLSINMYEKLIKKLDVKDIKVEEKKQKKLEEKKPNKEIILESSKKNASILTIEKIIRMFEGHSDIKSNSFREELRLLCKSINYISKFKTMLIYERYDNNLYYFRNDRLFDKHIKKQDIEGSLLNEVSKNSIEGFIEFDFFKKYNEIVSSKIFENINSVYSYLNDNIIIMYYFENKDKYFLEHEDFLKVASINLMFFHSMYLKNKKHVLNTNVLEKLMLNKDINLRIYIDGQYKYSESAKKIFEINNFLDLSNFIKNIQIDYQDRYKKDFKELILNKKKQYVSSYKYKEKYIKEFSSVYFIGDNVIALSYFEDNTERINKEEKIRKDLILDSNFGFKNKQAFIRELPEKLKNKLSILKLSVSNKIEYLYGKRKYKKYFKEFCFLTNKIINNKDIYILNDNSIIVIIDSNDKRKTERVIRSYEEKIYGWKTNSIDNEYFDPKIGIIRYPVVTSETNIDVLLQYLDLSIQICKKNNKNYHFFKYSDYEYEKKEQFVINEINYAIDHQNFLTGYRQIINKKRNKVWLYESFQYIENLDISEKDIRGIAERRDRIILFDMSHIEKTLSFIRSIYENSIKSVKFLLPLSTKTIKSHLFFEKINDIEKVLENKKEVLQFFIDIKKKDIEVIKKIKFYASRGFRIHTNDLNAVLLNKVHAYHHINQNYDMELETIINLAKIINSENKFFVLRNSSKNSKIFHEDIINYVAGEEYRILSKKQLLDKIINQ